MKFTKKLLLTVACICSVALVKGAELRYENYIYDDLVETVLLSTNSSVYNPMAVMDLGRTNALSLKFDKLESSNEFYQYTFVHCTSDWKLSNLQKTEYLEGNTMGEITDYSFSTNTFQQYVQYRMVFPSPDMRLTKSGNYLLIVYRNFDEEDLVLTRRFMVYEGKTNITGTVKPATNSKDRFYKQEVDFEIDYKDYLIQNPFNDVNAVVIQNNSWNNTIFNLRPQFVNNNVLQFNYENENLFDGLSEFRFFDIRTLRAFSQNVAKKFTDSLVNVVLKSSEIRSHLSYVNWIDYNGKRVIQNVDGGDVTENGDYTLVHFTLKSPNKIDMGDVYVYGELSDWRLQEKFKMKYYAEKQIYYLAVKLKQSYYNYHFVLQNKNSGEMEYAYTEGNHAETENDYTILLYHRDAFYGYDRLIGKATLNSLTSRD
ncbi:MAG: DUF5103 domain-containing protein [Bacteroidia bacterium]|nr:DUF5103 domain-containing protein [Bacteroidia bacterium]